jgi:hypothetical protein
MRFLRLLALLVPALSAQDAREIVRRSVEIDSGNTAAARNYTFLQRQETRKLDGAGRVKDTESLTYDVTLQEGSPYRRLVARDDKPLSEKDQREEQEKLRRSNEIRSHETPEQREQRIADWHRKQEDQRKPLKELPDAFDFRLLPNEAIDGAECWVIEASPKPGYKPKAASAFFFPKVRARFWIARTNYQWVKFDMEALDTIAFKGILVRLSKGSHLVMDQQHVNGEVWLPRRIVLNASARILLIKGFHAEIVYSFSDYRKFQVDSRVIAAQ